MTIKSNGYNLNCCTNASLLYDINQRKMRSLILFKLTVFDLENVMWESLGAYKIALEISFLL